jgi:predicted chitinase
MQIYNSHKEANAMTKKAKKLGESTTTESGKNKVERVRLSCACNRDLTLDELTIAYPERGKPTLEKFLPELNKSMTRYSIVHCIKKAHFLAQVGHESAELQYVAEVLPAGVTEAVAYKGYKGRGLIQLTLKNNYERYGAAVGENFLEDNRIKLEETKWAADSAGWYWLNGAAEDLNPPADKNDLIFISAAINGGFNGYEGSSTGRLELLQAAVDALNLQICPRLETLFATFPEKLKFSYELFKLEDSIANDKLDMAFAWGHWHDPEYKKKGTQKNAAQAKLGYSRYIELIGSLTETQVKNLQKKRFGIKREDMKTIAENRIKNTS